MGILTNSLKDLIIQMREHDEKMLRKVDDIIIDAKASIEALKILDREIDSIDKILSE